MHHVIPSQKMNKPEGPPLDPFRRGPKGREQARIILLLDQLKKTCIRELNLAPLPSKRRGRPKIGEVDDRKTAENEKNLQIAQCVHHKLMSGAHEESAIQYHLALNKDLLIEEILGRTLPESPLPDSLTSKNAFSIQDCSYEQWKTMGRAQGYEALLLSEQGINTSSPAQTLRGGKDADLWSATLQMTQRPLEAQSGVANYLFRCDLQESGKGVSVGDSSFGMRIIQALDNDKSMQFAKRKQRPDPNFVLTMIYGYGVDLYGTPQLLGWFDLQHTIRPSTVVRIVRENLHGLTLVSCGPSTRRGNKARYGEYIIQQSKTCWKYTRSMGAFYIIKQTS